MIETLFLVASLWGGATEAVKIEAVYGQSSAYLISYKNALNKLSKYEPRLSSGAFTRYNVKSASKIETINAAINKKPYEFDRTKAWEINSQGDCKGKVFAKMLRLQAEGVPAGSMSLVIGKTKEFHAVLMLHTTEGDYVLDTKTNIITGWQNVAMQYHYMHNAGNWFNMKQYETF